MNPTTESTQSSGENTSAPELNGPTHGIGIPHDGLHVFEFEGKCVVRCFGGLCIQPKQSHWELAPAPFQNALAITALLAVIPERSGTIQLGEFLTWVSRRPSRDPDEFYNEDISDPQLIFGHAYNRWLLGELLKPLINADYTPNLYAIVEERLWNGVWCLVVRVGQHLVCLAQTAHKDYSEFTDPCPVTDHQTTVTTQAAPTVEPAPTLSDREKIALNALQYTLDRIQREANLWHYFDLTESYSRLCKAEAALTGESEKVVAARRGNPCFPKNRPQVAEVVELEQKLAVLEPMVAEIEDTYAHDLVVMGIIKRHREAVEEEP